MGLLQSKGKMHAEKKDRSINATNGLSLYDIELIGLDGTAIDLSKFKGKYLLFVNVASKCGFTSQYRDLEALSQQYADQLVVIGLPCNQFGGQEPGNSEAIRSFCSLNYGVSFPLSEKIKVKGSEQHPLYAWLTQKKWNQKANSKVRWNFQKYLVSPEGKLIDYFYSTTSPLSGKITKKLL